MPVVPFDELPAASQLWLFGAAAPIDDVDEQRVLATVDAFLKTWKAHEQPLYAARDWRDGRFLAVAVDTSREGASGCSIDGLFRALKGIEGGIGTTLLDRSLVYYRDKADFVHGVSREDFTLLAKHGDVGPDTPVMDLSLTDVGAYRASFIRPVKQSWHQSLLP